MSEVDQEFTKWLNNSTAEELLEQAEELMVFGKAAEMLNLLKAVQERISDIEDPTRIRAVLIEGWWCARMDQYSTAEAKFESTIKLAEKHLGNAHPTYIDGLLLRANATVRGRKNSGKHQKQLSSDLATVFRFLKQSEDKEDYRSVEANYLLFRSLIRKNDKEALAALDRAIEACRLICGEDDPEHPFLVLQKAGCYVHSHSSEIPTDLPDMLEAAAATFLYAFEDELDDSYRAAVATHARILKRLDKPEASEIEAKSRELENLHTENFSIFNRQMDFTHKLADWRARMGRNPRIKR